METFQLNAFDFDKIKLSTPQAIQGGGAYFTNLTFNDNPIFIHEWLENLENKCKSLLDEKKIFGL